MSRATTIDTAITMYNHGNLYGALTHICENGGTITEEQFMSIVRMREKEDQYIHNSRKRTVKPIAEEKVMMSTDVLDRDSSYWTGPQFKVYEDETMMGLVDTEDGYVSEGGTYYPGTVPTTFVYQVGGENDWYVTEDHNPDLITGKEIIYDMKGKVMKRSRRKLNQSEVSWMAAHGYLVDSVDDFWEEYVKCSYTEINTDSDDDGDGDGDGNGNGELNKLSNIQFSKERTEVKDYKLLNFWGYSGDNYDHGYSSVIWSAIRYGRAAAIKRVVDMKGDLTAGELEWLREMLGDKNISLPWYIRNLLPIRNTSTSKFNLEERMEWLEISRNYLFRLPDPDPTPTKKGLGYINNVIRHTYIGQYTRKDGTVVKAHYRKITKKAIIAWTKNLKSVKSKENTERFTKFVYTEAASFKYPGKKHVTLEFIVDGKRHIRISKVQGCTNWLGVPTNMTHKTLNDAVRWARKEVLNKLNK